MLKKLIVLACLLLFSAQVIGAEAAPSVVCLPSDFSGGTIIEDSAFCDFGTPYTLTADVYVPPSWTLFIEQGVVIEWEGPYELHVDGSLQAIGTASDPITITSGRAPQQPGDWRYILLGENSTDNELVYVIIEYAGFTNLPAIRVRTDDFSFRNSTIRNNLQEGVWVQGSDPFLWELDVVDNGASAVLVAGASSPDWFHFDVSGNGYNGVELSGVEVNSDLMLGFNGIMDYRLTDDLTVNEDVTLTIMPGTTIGFKHSTCGQGRIDVHGSLIAEGTSESRIGFTGQQTSCRGSGRVGEYSISSDKHKQSALNMSICLRVVDHHSRW